MIATTPELSGRFAGVVRCPLSRRAQKARNRHITSRSYSFGGVLPPIIQSNRSGSAQSSKASKRSSCALFKSATWASANLPSMRSLSCVPRCQSGQSLLRRIWACWFDNRSATLPRSLMMAFPAYCTDIGIMLLLRLAMIQIEPVMTRKTISTPKARARILFV